MEAILERCYGLDVHQKTVVASVITSQGQGTRTFRTMTQGLLELADWPGEDRVGLFGLSWQSSVFREYRR